MRINSPDRSPPTAQGPSWSEPANAGERGQSWSEPSERLEARTSSEPANAGERGRVIPLRREGVDLAEISDEALIAGCATGDRGARAVLFERHVSAIHRFISRLSASDANAVDDLIQATFLEAFAAAAKFRGSSQVKTWLCGIALNVVRNYARSEIRRKNAMGNAAHAACVDITWASNGAILSAEHKQQFDQLGQALQMLSEELRSVFVMCDMEGMKGTEVAIVLGVPEGTVWRRLHDARGRLRASMTSTGGGL
jgi:RNA polymerase sigma factor (sigma-70 family)